VATTARIGVAASARIRYRLARIWAVTGEIGLSQPAKVLASSSFALSTPYDGGMTATFLHTMVRITDPAKSRGFYEALGFRFSRDMDIVRNGELEATNYFFSLGDDENVLELTYNHDGRAYDPGTGYGHIAIGVDDLDGTLSALKSGSGIEPERPPYQVSEGGSRICFVRDPDGYRIELIEASAGGR
jgi:lactoylglutathione lyase